MIRPLRRPPGADGKARAGLGEWISHDYRFVFLRWPRNHTCQWWSVISADDEAEDLLRYYQLKSQRFARLKDAIQAVEIAVEADKQAL